MLELHLICAQLALCDRTAAFSDFGGNSTEAGSSRANIMNKHELSISDWPSLELPFEIEELRPRRARVALNNRLSCARKSIIPSATQVQQNQTLPDISLKSCDLQRLLVLKHRPRSALMRETGLLCGISRYHSWILGLLWRCRTCYFPIPSMTAVHSLA